MKKTAAWIIVSTGLLAATCAQAQHSYLSDRHQDLRRTTEVFEQVHENDEGTREARAFVAQCSAVAPFRGFCGCLARRLPAGLSFQQYFAVLSRSKEQNNYDSLEPDVKKTYDAIPVVRDECAAAAATEAKAAS